MKVSTKASNTTTSEGACFMATTRRSDAQDSGMACLMEDGQYFKTEAPSSVINAARCRVPFEYFLMPEARLEASLEAIPEAVPEPDAAAWTHTMGSGAASGVTFPVARSKLHRRSGTTKTEFRDRREGRGGYAAWKTPLLYTAMLSLLARPASATTPSMADYSEVLSGSAFRCPFSILPDGSLKMEEAYDEEVVWCLPRSYSMERPPFLAKQYRTQHKLNLDFNFEIREISEVNDRGQSLSIPMYFSVAWRDSRLWINESNLAWQEKISGPMGEVNEDPRVLLNYIWVPDLEIYGLENFGSKKVLKEMSGLRIRKDKTIEFNTRVTIKMSCRMIFDNYPFDRHTCNFQVGSYYYLKDIVTCSSTYDDPVLNDPSRQRNLQHEIAFANLTLAESTIELNSGKYAACGFKMHLKRKRYQLLFQIYLPVALFVAVSWSSFLIRPEVVPGRMALLVTLFLVLVNIFNTVRSNAPIPASTSLNATDTYLVVSILMVFLALLEYAVVLLFMNIQDAKDVKFRKAMLKEKLTRQKTQPQSQNQNANNVNTVDDQTEPLLKMQDIMDDINSSLLQQFPMHTVLKGDYYRVGSLSHRRCDYIALIVMPVSFVIFNLVYWMNYTLFI